MKSRACSRAFMLPVLLSIAVSSWANGEESLRNFPDFSLLDAKLSDVPDDELCFINEGSAGRVYRRPSINRIDILIPRLDVTDAQTVELIGNDTWQASLTDVSESMLVFSLEPIEESRQVARKETFCFGTLGVEVEDLPAVGVAVSRPALDLPELGDHVHLRGSERQALVASVADEVGRELLNRSAGRVVAPSLVNRGDKTDSTYIAEIREDVQAGDVLVVDTEQSAAVKLSREPNDVAVVGIAAKESVRIGGARDVSHVPVLFAGVATCRVDARFGAIEPGDLLTTSVTPGHAMVALDATPGTILGKALGGLKEGTGLIRVLVSQR